MRSSRPATFSRWDATTGTWQPNLPSVTNVGLVSVVLASSVRHPRSVRAYAQGRLSRQANSIRMVSSRRAGPCCHAGDRPGWQLIRDRPYDGIARELLAAQVIAHLAACSGDCISDVGDYRPNNEMNSIVDQAALQQTTYQPLRIVHYPHPTLRLQSKPLRRVDAAVRQLVQEMFLLMYEAKGVGLAANQVNVPLRLFVVNLAGKPGEGEERVYINPVLSQPKGWEEQEEGCLSLPGVYARVGRPKRICVQAYDLSGQEIVEEASGLLARVIQHETDHLDGILFIDRLEEGQVHQELRDSLARLEQRFREEQASGVIPSLEAITQQVDEWQRRYA